ncbi:hypothetical protein ACVW0J_000815 [Bradyrhizobium sp. i1.7.7]
MARPSSTCGRPSTATSSESEIGLSPLPTSPGTNVATTAKAITPITVTAQNAARQPSIRPNQAPKGTPRSVATVRPMNMVAIADARLSSATRLVATTDPTPKKVPWASEVSTRAAISHS